MLELLVQCFSYLIHQQTPFPVSAPIYDSSMCIFSDAGVGGDTCRKNVQQGFQKVTGRIINTVPWRDEYVCRQSKLTLVILTDAI